LSDKTNRISPSGDYLQLGKALSDQFFVLEGKRPRILVGGTIDPLSRSMNKICNSLADMGYDVDLSPKVNILKNLLNQCLENDTDVVLIYGADCFSVQELLDFQDKILSDQPHIVMSLLAQNSECYSNCEEKLDQWILFKPEDHPYVIGYNLLNRLLLSS